MSSRRSLAPLQAYEARAIWLHVMCPLDATTNHQPIEYLRSPQVHRNLCDQKNRA